MAEIHASTITPLFNMQFEQAKKLILDRLNEELPRHLSYHSVDHVKDVYTAAENIGKLEHISAYDMQLLLTAALFHDSGFMHGPNNHEEESCRIASEYLPGFNYSDDEIEKINGMIMATKLPQTPRTPLEEIICDADLDYLGRDDFFPISDNLYAEFTYTGIVNNENDWNKIQVSFFEKHQYFTKSALRLREEKKEENLCLIRAKIKA
jgi:predicted metal-dependent HD superfamily phosphohydrolase